MNARFAIPQGHSVGNSEFVSTIAYLLVDMLLSIAKFINWPNCVHNTPNRPDCHQSRNANIASSGHVAREISHAKLGELLVILFFRFVCLISRSKATVEMSHNPVTISKVTRCKAEDPSSSIRATDTSASGFTNAELIAMIRRRFSRLIFV